MLLTSLTKVETVILAQLPEQTSVIPYDPSSSTFSANLFPVNCTEITQIKESNGIGSLRNGEITPKTEIMKLKYLF